MFGAGEDGHVSFGLCGHDVRDCGADAGDRAEEVSDVTNRARLSCSMRAVNSSVVWVSSSIR